MKFRLSHQLVAVFFFRLLLNTGRRFVYPFAPALSRGLDVPLTAVTTIIATSQFTSLIGIFSGPVADRIGTRFVMKIGLLFLAAGMLLCGLVPSYPFVFAGLILASLGKTIFDPAIQSYVGRSVPFERRGRAIGAIETAWAGSTLIGIPALGFIIESGGLVAAYYLLAILGGIGWIAIGYIIPKDEKATVEGREKTRMFSSLAKLFKVRPAAGMLAYGFWISIANDSLFVVYGLWFEEAFKVSIVTLGLSTVAIGAAELTGETVTALFSDKLGLRKTLFTALVFAILSYLCLPLLGLNLQLAMVGMFCVFLFFEITMVTSFSVCTELLPHSRATMMAGFYATAGVGRMAGVLIGSYLWHLGGIWGVASGAALLTFVGFLFLIWGLHGWQRKV